MARLYIICLLMSQIAIGFAAPKVYIEYANGKKYTSDNNSVKDFNKAIAAAHTTKKEVKVEETNIVSTNAHVNISSTSEEPTTVDMLINSTTSEPSTVKEFKKFNHSYSSASVSNYINNKVMFGTFLIISSVLF